MKLNTPLSASKLKLATWLGFFVGCMVLGVAIGLSFWQGILATVGFVLLAISAWLQPSPAHIACDGETWEFLLVGSTAQKQLWLGQAKLTDFGFCVLISAHMTHPQTNHKRWVVYADMPIKEQWYVLKALARFS